MAVSTVAHGLEDIAKEAEIAEKTEVGASSAASAFSQAMKSTTELGQSTTEASLISDDAYETPRVVEEMSEREFDDILNKTPSTLTRNGELVETVHTTLAEQGCPPEIASSLSRTSLSSLEETSDVAETQISRDILAKRSIAAALADGVRKEPAFANYLRKIFKGVKFATAAAVVSYASFRVYEYMVRNSGPFVKITTDAAKVTKYRIRAPYPCGFSNKRGEINHPLDAIIRKLLKAKDPCFEFEKWDKCGGWTNIRDVLDDSFRLASPNEMSDKGVRRSRLYTLLIDSYGEISSTPGNELPENSILTEIRQKVANVELTCEDATIGDALSAFGREIGRDVKDLSSGIFSGLFSLNFFHTFWGECALALGAAVIACAIGKNLLGASLVVSSALGLVIFCGVFLCARILSARYKSQSLS